MDKYFAGYYNKRPAVYCDDEFGLIRVHLKNRRSIHAAHNLAKNWNSHVRRKQKAPDEMAPGALKTNP